MSVTQGSTTLKDGAAATFLAEDLEDGTKRMPLVALGNTKMDPINPAVTTVTGAGLSGTITTGGTAQVFVAADATLQEVVVGNPDGTEDLWYALWGDTAAANGTGSYRLRAGQVDTITGAGAKNGVSIFGATTGHKFSGYKGI